MDICNSMKRSGIQPNVQSYNSVLEALATKNEIPFSLKLLGEMIQNNVAPDVFTANLIIRMHAPFGDFLGAMAIYEMLDSFGLKPNSETFTSLVAVAACSMPHCCISPPPLSSNCALGLIPFLFPFLFS